MAWEEVSLPCLDRQVCLGPLEVQMAPLPP
jgi:hypothetical protein